MENLKGLGSVFLSKPAIAIIVRLIFKVYFS